MGKLVSSTIPNLISGVSQQPWNVRLPTQAEEQVNCQASVTDFLKRRPATRHLARIMDSGGEEGVAVHAVNRDEAERYILVAGPASGINVFDLAGRPKTVITQGSGAAYLATASNPAQDLRFLTINDYTFVLSRKATVKTLPDLSPKRPPEAIVFIKQASYNTTYEIILDGTTHAFTTEDGIAPADEPADKLSSLDICKALAGQIPTATFTVQTSNSTLWIRRKDGRDFTVKAQDSRSNTHISACKGTVQRFSDLPTVAPRGFVTEIIGDSSSSFDNYFCAFEPLDTGDAFGPGAWKECVKPGIPFKLDPATLPHALVRQADGTFTFGPLDWAGRVCGDETSAPFPSFTDRAINGLFFYRNRLSFLSGENVVMSEVGEFFNFFNTTATTLVDSDPVDVAASHTKSSLLQHAVAFSGGLLLFSEQSQFALEHDTVLSNATVSIKPVTEFEASMKAAPVSSGKTVFFATDKGAWGGVREYITLPDSSDQNDASDVTAHVPRYIRGGIDRLACSTNEDILLVLSEQERRSLWVYKYFWNGNEKIQSAWHRWAFCGDVLAAAVLNTGVYLVMRYADSSGGGLYLEKMDITPGHKDEGETFEYCLDRKITERDITLGDYDAVTKTLTVTLPYDVPEGSPLFVTRRGGPRSPGVLLDASPVPGSDRRTFRLTGQGDPHGQPLFIGIPYTSAYTFSTFAIREGDNKGNAVTSGRLQLRRLTLNCANTGFLRMRVTPKFRPTSTYAFTGRETGHGTNILGDIPLYTGTVSCPLLSLNTQAEVRVDSDSFLPFALVNATWEGFYNTRNTRV